MADRLFAEVAFRPALASLLNTLLRLSSNGSKPGGLVAAFDGGFVSYSPLSSLRPTALQVARR